ncbi:MAG: hypothetical protein QGG42_05950 [Phycisphaerae bacterium]|jgi:hypothetical protein|nr:hypothetical protein [Phycisphaerae bacterium]
MKRFACILICAAAVAGLDQIRAADKTETKKPRAKTTTFTPRLSKGDRFVLEITRGRTQTGRPAMAKTKGFQAIEVEILNADEKNVLIGWTSRKTGILDPSGKPIALPPQAAGLATIFDGVQMIFELSPKYEMIGLKNIEQIRPIVTKAIDKTLAVMNRSREDKTKIRQTVVGMLSSRKTIEQICNQQITLLLATAQLKLEGDLDSNAASETDCEFPMPMSGGVIPAKIATKVTNVDRASKRATLTMNTKMDPEKAARAMLAAMQAIARKTGRPAPTEKDLPKVDIRDVRTYVIDLKTNLPLSAEHTRTTAVGGKKRTDTVKIVRKPAKATVQSPSATPPE